MKNWENKDYVLEYVKESGISLMFASSQLKADKDVVLQAVKSDGIALFYADKKLREDKVFVLECIKYSHLCLGAVDPTYYEDYNFVRESVIANPKCFFILAKYFNYSKDKPLCLLACMDYTTLSAMDKSLLKSTDFAEELIKVNPMTFKILSAYKGENVPHNQNINLIKQAVQANAFCFTFVDKELKSDDTFIEEMIKLNSSAYYYQDDKNKLNPKLALLAVTDNAELLAEVPSIVCSSRFLAQAVEANPAVYEQIKSKDKNLNLSHELNLLNVDNIDKYVVECTKNEGFNLKIEKPTTGNFNGTNNGGLALI